MCDVMIIGGGVIGCAVARELSRYRLDTILLEKREDVCSGASKANTAIVHAGFDAEPGSNKARYNVLGNAMFEDICRDLDVPFRRNEALVIAREDEDLSVLEALKQRGEENGVPGLRIIDRQELRQREPNVSEKAVAALLAPSSGIVCPFRLTVALAENAAENGVMFRRNAGVKRIIRESEGWTVELDSGEVIHSQVIVNCAGVDSARLNNQVSVRRFCIRPRRGEYFLLDKSFSGMFRETIFQLPSEKGKGVVVVETVDGNILLGPTAEDMDPETQLEDNRTTQQGLEQVRKAVLRTWEHIPDRKFITNFAGVRASSSTGDFVLGEVADAPFFFNAAGIESPGLTSAPAIGAELAHAVAQRLNAQVNENFNPVRKDIKLLREATMEEQKALIEEDSAYGQIICRCEMVTEAEIRQAIRRPVGARSLDGVKRRVRAGAGRCQAGFCAPRVLEILSEELGREPCEITKFGGKSNILIGRIGKEGGGNA